MQGHQIALDLYSATGVSESQSLGYAESCEPREQSLCGTIQFVVATESSARSLGVCNVDKLTARGYECYMPRQHFSHVCVATGRTADIRNWTQSSRFGLCLEFRGGSAVAEHLMSGFLYLRLGFDSGLEAV